MKQTIFRDNIQIEYFTKGTNPKLLLDSGMHGDEFMTIDSLQKSVNDHYEQLADFLYIPIANPVGVKLRQRGNGNGLDVNRNFGEDTDVVEAQLLMEITKPYHFDLSVSFHEDYEQKNFYMYDSGAFANPRIWKNFKHRMQDNGYTMLHGYDDLEDSGLGMHFYDGYRSLSRYEATHPQGNFWSWAIPNKIVKRLMVVEVPGLLNQKEKDHIVELFFQNVLIPLCMETKIEVETHIEANLQLSE